MSYMGQSMRLSGERAVRGWSSSYGMLVVGRHDQSCTHGVFDWVAAKRMPQSPESLVKIFANMLAKNIAKFRWKLRRFSFFDFHANQKGLSPGFRTTRLSRRKKGDPLWRFSAYFPKNLRQTLVTSDTRVSLVKVVPKKIGSKTFHKKESSANSTRKWKKLLSPQDTGSLGKEKFPRTLWTPSQHQWCIKFLGPREKDFYTPLALRLKIPQ